MSELFVAAAEQHVIGLLMTDPAGLDEVEGLITADSFYFTGHCAAFEAIQRLHREGKQCDALSVWAELGNTADQERIGGQHVLMALEANWGVDRRLLRRHAEIVAEKAKLRSVLALLEEAKGIATEPAGLSDKLDRIGALMAGIDSGNAQRRPKPMSELMARMLEKLDSSDSTLPRGWATGIPTLDKFHGGGLSPGKLIVLAARPSVGKSSLSMHILAQIARSGHPCLAISQEMEDMELVQRALANASRVESDAIQSGDMTQDEWSRIVEGAEFLGNAQIWIDDEPGQSMRAINTKARSIKGLKVLVVDYLQLCEGEGDTRSAAVGSISRGLKKLAKQLGCCVIALSQLNRQVDARADKRPVMSDLRDSGEIEQDADSIWFLWTLAEGEYNEVGLDIAKNRGGKKGAFVMNFHGGHQTWSESTKRLSDFQAKKQGGFE